MLKSRPLPAPVLYTLAFTVPTLVLLWVYVQLGMAPWGDNTILSSDMSSQYVEFFCALKHGDVFFSWSKALGTTYIGVFSYYVSSPLSVLTLLVPNQYMPMGLMFLTVLKLGLAGLTCCLFLRHYLKRSTLFLPLLAACYALCSYSAAYSLCIMWLDGLIWLPVILLGLEWIISGGRPWLFFGSLVVCFLSTWYISYMIGIFCCLWLVYRLGSQPMPWNDIARLLRTFLLSALAALAVTAWMWIPSLLSIFRGKLGDATVDYSSLTNFSLWELPSRLLPGQGASLTNSALPYLFCGTIVVILALTFFLLPTISGRTKVSALAVLVFLVLSLWLSPLDKMWHLFQMPNWFPYRYSFVCSFFLIVLAGEALNRLPESWFSWKLAPIIPLMLLGFTAWELGCNTQVTLLDIRAVFGCQSYSDYVAYYQENEALVEQAQEDGDFFRMGATYDRGDNSPLSFGYAGITHYSSIYNKQVNTFLKQLGFAQGWMWSVYYGSTPVTDSLLGVRYVLSDQEFPGYEEVGHSGSLTLWENPDVLPLAYVSQGQVGRTLPVGATPFQVQNQLLSQLTGAEQEVFSSMDLNVQEGPGQITLIIPGTGNPVYIYLDASGLTSLSVNGNDRCSLTPYEEQRIHSLGAPAVGETLEVTITWDTSLPALGWTAMVQQLDQEALRQALAQLDNTQVETVTNSQVVLQATSDTPSTLVTTIPAEPGWTAYVDGQKVDTGVCWNTVLTLELSSGTHQITLRYTPPGLIPGLVLGGVTILMGLVWLVWSRKKSR
ncbi:YfhO family protein [Pseudoflavonifractor sp. An85]|uniref:YfhO family protein n=1 Tax=Pseudoflavonifractor sp. An85 TaxID=1965661 RepID=UPI001302B88B|nr:YfhO family protein [Pseudoflavonifractor sp. An85]